MLLLPPQAGRPRASASAITARPRPRASRTVLNPATMVFIRAPFVRAEKWPPGKAFHPLCCRAFETTSANAGAAGAVPWRFREEIMEGARGERAQRRLAGRPRLSHAKGTRMPSSDLHGKEKSGMSLASGATFGAYRIIEPLGRGGMASVYKVYEAALDRYVALKVLPGEFLHDETFAERFKREAKVVARLEHPNIIPIHAFGIESGIPWMAMRLISGGALSSLLRGGRLTHERIITILRGAADALDYAHGKGVVHRDVKPQNILLDEAERVYLADFGIAKMVEGSGALTQTGMITGTPQYMAPEQATAQSVDQRVDTYALGVVAYEMLTGRL